MQVTDVRITMPNRENGEVKARANIVIDGAVAIHGISVILHQDGTFQFRMPNREIGAERKDIVHPINSESRKIISDALEAALKQRIETDLA